MKRKVDLTPFIEGKRKANRATDAEALALLRISKRPLPKRETKDERKQRLASRRNKYRTNRWGRK